MLKLYEVFKPIPKTKWVFFKKLKELRFSNCIIYNFFGLFE